MSACQNPKPLPVLPTVTAGSAALTPASPTAAPPLLTPTLLPAATPTPLSAEAIMRAAFDAVDQAGSYRFDMDMNVNWSGSDPLDSVKVPMRYYGDVVAPDRVRGTMTLTTSDGDVELQMMAVDGVHYTFNPVTRRWQVVTQSNTFFVPDQLLMDLSDLQELVLVGETTVEGIPVYHLTARALLPFSFGEPLGEVEADMQVEYWVGQEDQRIVRSVVEGILDFGASRQITAALSMTAYLFDYDAPIEIVAPELATAAVIDVPDAGPLAIEARLLAPLASDTPEGHVQRGLASLADGRLGLALAHFDHALALRPDWPEGLLYRGAILAIYGDFDNASYDLDQAIEASPAWADAFALRAWMWMRAALSEEYDQETVLRWVRGDVTLALALQPDLPAARSLQGLADVLTALALFESDPEEAIEGFEKAIAALNEVLAQSPDDAAGSFLPFAYVLFRLNQAEQSWLNRQIDEAATQIEVAPESYAAYATRGLARLFVQSQGAGALQSLQASDSDLLTAIALMHERLPALADPTGGPLQIARIWDLREATYSIGSIYNDIFSNHDLEMFPEYAQMLASYWELFDLFVAEVGDPTVFSVAFSPDGSQIATLSQRRPSRLVLWDAASGEPLHEVDLDLDGRMIAADAGSLAYSPDSSQIVAAYANRVARVLDTRSGAVKLELIHDKRMDSAAYSPDGARIATVSPGAAGPLLWDAVTGEKMTAMKVESPITTVAFSPDGQRMVGGGEQVHLWDMATGDIIATLPGGDPTYMSAPAVSPDGRLLAVPGYPVTVYDLPSATAIYTIPLGARAVAFSPDGSQLATAGFDAVGVWDAATGALNFLAGHAGSADAVAWSPDGRRLATGGSDGRLRIWDAATGAELWNALAVRFVE
jgi:WD40 repeat protein